MTALGPATTRALEAAATLIRSRAAQLPPEQRVLIGLAGAPGAGKTTFSAELAPLVDGTVVPMDGFHLPQARLVELGRRDRMGAPDTFDVDGFVALLSALRGPGAVTAPLFDREAEESVPGALTIEPGHRILLIEGNYLLHDTGGWERVAPLLDATVFLRLDGDVRRDRLIARHAAGSKTLDEARAWVLRSDESNARLVADGWRRADLALELD